MPIRDMHNTHRVTQKEKSDVVRGQVVRSVKEQVDSVIDSAVIRLYCLRSASTLWQALASVARSSSSDTEFLFLFLFSFSFSFLFFFSCAFFFLIFLSSFFFFFQSSKHAPKPKKIVEKFCL